MALEENRILIHPNLLTIPNQLRSCGEDFAARSKHLHGLIVELVVHAVAVHDAEQVGAALGGEFFFGG